MRAIAVLAACCVLLSAAAADAGASTVAVEDHFLVYTGAPGEADSPEFAHEGDAFLRVWDDGLEGGPGCSAAPDPRRTSYRCESADVTNVVLELGDGADRVAPALRLPVLAAGGAGADDLFVKTGGHWDGGDGDDTFRLVSGTAPYWLISTIVGGAGRDLVKVDAGEDEGWRISLDGDANDGTEYRLNVLEDVEDIEGGPHRDLLIGSDGANRISGGPGSDNMAGGAGADVIDAIDVDPRPSPAGTGYDQTPDVVSCNDGRDTVDADVSDLVAHDCERVRDWRIVVVESEAGGREERLELARTILNGTSGRDRLTGIRRSRNRILGFGGADRIAGGRKRDDVYAGSGNDSVDARDRSRDYIHCGAGQDRVTVDRHDAVARDCEIVRRGR